jgi:hypothetical protein
MRQELPEIAKARKRRRNAGRDKGARAGRAATALWGCFFLESMSHLL